MKPNNPYLKQIITEISKHALTGRIYLKEVEDTDKSADDVEEPVASGEDKEAPAEEPSKEPDAAEPKADEKPEADAEPTDADESGDEDVEAEADEEEEKALKAKADLEKAKAEKTAAEKELQKQSYIKLNTSSGVRYLLDKIVTPAFESNTIDALAGEMIEKLKIDDKEKYQKFSAEMGQYTNIPGVVNLLSSMKNMIETK